MTHTIPDDDAGRPNRVVAATWLCRREGEVLAVRPRSSDAYFLPGGMPVAGETFAQAAAREVQEEIGVLLHPDELTEVVRVEAPAHGRPGFTVLLVCFTGPGRGDPVADGDEVVEVSWLRPDQWFRFAPAVRQALAQV